MQLLYLFLLAVSGCSVASALISHTRSPVRVRQGRTRQPSSQGGCTLLAFSRPGVLAEGALLHHGGMCSFIFTSSVF